MSFLKGLVIFAAVWLIYLVIMSDAGQIFSERIVGEKHASRIVEEEKKKLELGDGINIKILWQTGTEDHIAVEFLPENNREFKMILLSKQLRVTRASIRHELYHIFRVRCFDMKRVNPISYILMEEPLAVFYGTTSTDPLGWLHNRICPKKR